MAHQISYAYEKFMVALDSLAASDAPLKRRLIYAYDQLHRFDAERSFGDHPEMAEVFRQMTPHVGLSPPGRKGVLQPRSTPRPTSRPGNSQSGS